MADVLLTTVLVVIVLVAAAAAIRRLFDRITIFEFERGLRYRAGRFAGIVGPGQYWLPRWRTAVRKVDLRPSTTTIPGQEVISADGVSLRVSVAVRYAIADPAVAVNNIEDYHAAMHVAVQLALREIVGSTPIEQLLEHRGDIGAELVKRVAPEFERFGLQLETADVKDLMFPGDLRRTFAQVVAARQEGLAALERARGETAALRNLANAARLIDTNPNLLQLRLLQQLATSGGNTIVLGLPTTTTPLPLRPGDEGVQPPELPSQTE